MGRVLDDVDYQSITCTHVPTTPRNSQHGRVMCKGTPEDAKPAKEGPLLRHKAQYASDIKKKKPERKKQMQSKHYNL